VLENEEMYGEQFSVPEPLETVFISWFARAAKCFAPVMTWRRGAGNIFYFRPGHETYPTYHNDDNVQKVLINAVKWAHNPLRARYSEHPRCAERPGRKGTGADRRAWSRNCTRPAKPGYQAEV
jgi:trehalose utilization protein